jgi:mannose-6-phosphate isomerase-like protein (cupin superfamily)
MNTNVLHAGQGRSFWVVGDLYTFLATGEDTNGAYALIHALVPPGGGPPPHIHRREDEAFFVLEGELSCQIDGQSLTATTGAWVTLPKGSLHAFKSTGPTPVKMLILVNPSGLERYFSEIGHATKEESVTPAAIEKLLAVAPKYGLEIKLPAQGELP